MILNLVTTKRSEINTACKAHRVRRLVLFGSILRDDFDHHQHDVDLLVEFEEMPPSEHKDAYFGLLDTLTAILGKDVDLVEATAIRNPFVKRRIENEQVTVYAAA